MIPDETMPAKPAQTLEEVQQAVNDLNDLKMKMREFADRFQGREGVGQRWLAIGITDVEKGVMAMTAAISEVALRKAHGELQAVLAELTD